MVRKDVLRTDRQHKFYSGETNENITALYNILTTYALHYPSVGYCQGMSDLLSPILMIMQVNVYTTFFYTFLMRKAATSNDFSLYYYLVFPRLLYRKNLVKNETVKDFEFFTLFLSSELNEENIKLYVCNVYPDLDFSHFLIQKDKRAF